MYARLLREIVVVIRGGWGLMDTKDAPPLRMRPTGRARGEVATGLCVALMPHFLPGREKED